jgi:hypothetical protein
MEFEKIMGGFVSYFLSKTTREEAHPATPTWMMTVSQLALTL